MDFLSGGQLIDWNEEAGIFFNKKQKNYISENELKKIFRELVDGLDYCIKELLMKNL